MNITENPAIADAGLDFQLISNNAFVHHQQIDLAGIVIANLIDIEIVVDSSEVFSFIQDDLPAQSGLEGFQNKEFVEIVVIMARNSPFIVMITDIQRIPKITPFASGQIKLTALFHPAVSDIPALVGIRAMDACFAADLLPLFLYCVQPIDVLRNPYCTVIRLVRHFLDLIRLFSVIDDEYLVKSQPYFANQVRLISGVFDKLLGHFSGVLDLVEIIAIPFVVPPQDVYGTIVPLIIHKGRFTNDFHSEV